MASNVRANMNISIDLMKAISFVPRRSEKDDFSTKANGHGYQRNATTSRFSKIARYYRNDPTKMTRITVSVRSVGEAEVDQFLTLLQAGNVKAIHKKWGRHCFAVVDGQHRLGGVYKASKDTEGEFDHPVEVEIRFGMTFAEETGFFDDMNKEQKGIAASIVSLNEAEITKVTDTDYPQRVRQLAIDVCEHSNSPWAGRVNMTGERDKTRLIQYEGVRRSISKMMPKTLLERLEKTSPSLPFDMVCRYWDLVVAMFPSDFDENRSADLPDSRFVQLVGFASLCQIGGDIITAHLASEDKEALEHLTAKLAPVKWAKSSANPWMSSQQAGFAGQKDMHEMLYNVVFNDEWPEGSQEFNELLSTMEELAA